MGAYGADGWSTSAEERALGYDRLDPVDEREPLPAEVLALARDIEPTLRSSERWIAEAQGPAARVIAHAALAVGNDQVRKDVVEEAIGPDLDAARVLADVALECIAIAEPAGGRTSEEALGMIRWRLAQAIRPTVEAFVFDRLGDHDPAYERFADEPYEQEDADYDCREDA